jgi:hypothetical protein
MNAGRPSETETDLWSLQRPTSPWKSVMVVRTGGRPHDGRRSGMNPNPATLEEAFEECGFHVHLVDSDSLLASETCQ